ncbi:MAG: MBL fold metallo-hydrolase, partial [Gammaproteobacteria bacterium]|nr:MBL fold metallo-hydrolase [Gammaproteobacteria bacterium]
VRTPADQGWFEIYHVQPDVYAIYEPGQFEEVISYLIVGSQQALLFDTGLGIGDIHKVVTALTSLPVIVLNSHSHYDHIGGNYQFDQILGTQLPYSKARTAGLDHDEVHEFVGTGWIWKPTPKSFVANHYAIRPFTIAAAVTDGEIIDLGGRLLEVLLTPGHAPDAVCLFDARNGLLFMGDTFYLAPLYTHLPGSDFAKYRTTVHRLAQLQPRVKHLLPAHNETLVSADYLPRLARAFDAIANDSATYILTDGVREYGFDDFSIMVNPVSSFSVD